MCCSTKCWSLLLCLIGLGIVGVTYYIEIKVHEDPSYKPFCDIDENISCTKAFNSSWGTGFGLVKYVVDENHWLNQPNPIYGFFVYPFLAFLSLFNVQFFARLQTFLTFLLNCGSVYLGYILYFVLEDVCVLCVSLYVINFLLFVVSYCRYRGLRSAAQLQREERHNRQRYSLPTTGGIPMDFKKNI